MQSLVYLASHRSADMRASVLELICNNYYDCNA
jgi:hypothetical protein